jgi:hypothetical protein
MIKLLETVTVDSSLPAVSERGYALMAHALLLLPKSSMPEVNKGPAALHQQTVQARSQALWVTEPHRQFTNSSTKALVT